MRRLIAIAALLLTSSDNADEWERRYSEYRRAWHPDQFQSDGGDQAVFLDFSDMVKPRTAREVVFMASKSSTEIDAVIEALQTRFALEREAATTLTRALLLDALFFSATPESRGEAIRRVRTLYDAAIAQSNHSPVVLREDFAFLISNRQHIRDAVGEISRLVRNEPNVPRAALTAMSVLQHADRGPFLALARERYGSNGVVQQTIAQASANPLREVEVLREIAAGDPKLRAVLLTRRLHALLTIGREAEALALFDSLPKKERTALVDGSTEDLDREVDGVSFVAYPRDVSRSIAAALLRVGRSEEAVSIVSRFLEGDDPLLEHSGVEAHFVSQAANPNSDPYDAIRDAFAYGDAGLWRSSVWAGLLADVAKRGGYLEVVSRAQSEAEAGLASARAELEADGRPQSLHENIPRVPQHLRLPFEQRLGVSCADAHEVQGLVGYQLVRLDRFEDQLVAIVASREVDPMMGPSRGGYWLTRSTDGGRAWERPLYLGLRDLHPYRIAARSAIPLRYDDVLLIEVDLREIDPASINPTPLGTRYSRREDELFLEISMNDLRRDTDGDGVTDLLEASLLTRPDLADTDGDKIRDGVDFNPRVARGEGVSDEAKILQAMSRDRAELLRDVNPMLQQTTLFVIGKPRDYESLDPDMRVIVMSPEERRSLATTEIIITHRDGARAFAQIADGAMTFQYDAEKKDGKWSVKRGRQMMMGCFTPPE